MFFKNLRLQGILQWFEYMWWRTWSCPGVNFFTFVLGPLIIFGKDCTSQYMRHSLVKCLPYILAPCQERRCSSCVGSLQTVAQLFFSREPWASSESAHVMAGHSASVLSQGQLFVTTLSKATSQDKTFSTNNSDFIVTHSDKIVDQDHFYILGTDGCKSA